MMRRIIESSLKLRLLVVTIAAVVMVVGLTELRDMPVAVLPEFAPPYVEVQTEALGLSAKEVEDLVTLNVEELLSGVPWLVSMHSRSVPGMSSIILTFEPGTNLMRARQMVQERLTLAYALPNASRPPTMLQPLSATSRVMMIGLSSSEVSLMEMSVLARWTIKPKLLGVPGVANVAVWGDRDRQLQVQIDPERLQAHGVTQDQIIETTGNALWISPLTFLEASHPGTGGWIDGPQQRLEVRHVLPISRPEQLARMPIKGTSLRLDDVANVVEGHPPLIGDALLNESPGLLLVVEKLPGASTIQVTKGLEAAIEAMQPGMANIEMDTTMFRSASFIEMAFANLALTAVLAGVLVLLILGALLSNWRAALIAIVVIPVSLLATVMVLEGGTLNTMVLAGLVIALGAVVDDAIISVENMVRRLRTHRTEGAHRSAARVIRDAAFEMRGAMLYATLILVLALVPILLMEGPTGAFFQPLAFSFALALVISMVVALTLTPALGFFLLRNASVERHDSALVGWMQRSYETVLLRITDAPRTAFVTAAVVLVAGVVSWPFLEQSLIPTFKEPYVRVDWEGPPGTSHPAMMRMMSRASRELRSVPGVSDVHVHVGRAVTGDQVVDVNASQLWVRIDPQAEYDATLAAIQETVSGYPGLDHAIESYLTDRVRTVLENSGTDIVVRVYGKERNGLRAQAARVQDVLAGINGIVDLQVEGEVLEPQIEIEVDPERAEPYGLKPGDVRRAAATVFAGIGVGFLFEEQKVYDVVVWGTPETRSSVSDVRNLLIEAPRGGHVRLGEIADVRIAPSPVAIYHDAVSPRIEVVANVRGRDFGSVVRDVENGLAELDFPVEYYPVLLNEIAERQVTKQRLLVVGIAVAIGVFLILQAAFGSWRLAGWFFLSLPVALAGSALAAMLDGGVLSLGSVVGFLGVFAIAVRNGMTLIDHYQRLETEEGVAFGMDLVRRGTRERFPAIVMTAAVTAAALLPLVIFGNIAGLEIVHPLAVVMLGGLVTSTFVTLVVVPALYVRLGAKREPDLGIGRVGEEDIFSAPASA